MKRKTYNINKHPHEESWPHILAWSVSEKPNHTVE